MSDSMGTKEAATKWGVKQSTVSRWCREGKIDGAEQDAKGSPWHIPKDAKAGYFSKHRIIFQQYNKGSYKNEKRKNI